MKASELRIGNLVSNGINHYAVDINMLYDLATLEHYPIEPIPLTPEILDKCGFEKNNIGHNDFDIIALYAKEEFEIIQYSDGFGWDTGLGKISDTNYIHQLQNLFYCLTGEELKVKP